MSTAAYRTPPPAGQVARTARAVTGLHAIGCACALALWAVTLDRAHHPGWLEWLFNALNVPVSGSLVSVVVLALMTRALLDRKRIGVVAVVVCQLLGTYLSAVMLLREPGAPGTTLWRSHAAAARTCDLVALVAGPVVLWWLWRARRAFPGRLSPGSRVGVVGVLLGGLVLTAAVAWLSLLLTRPAAGDGWREVLAVVASAVGDPGDLHDLPAGVPVWALRLTELVAAGTLLAAVVTFLRSAHDRGEWSGERELAIRRLLATWGDRDSLGYFATRRDKLAVFGEDGRAVLTYRVQGGVCLASGDPVGDPAAWDQAIAAWVDHSHRYGWVPAVVSASEEGARAFARAGFGVVGMGDEAVLDPAHLDLGRASMTPVRHAVRRATRAGLTVQARRQDEIPPDELGDILRHAALWRGEKAERGYSMALGREGDPADGRILFVTAYGADGALVGLLSLVPWGRSRASLDLMRRSPQAPNGVTELLVTHLLEHARELGVREVSLNFCMFRSVYAASAELGARPLTRLNSSVLGFLDRFWQLERLYRANLKYEPRWQPRYLCLNDWMSLPQVAVAVGQAEGFLPLPPFTRPRRSPSLTPQELTEAIALGRSPAVDADALGPRRTDQTRHRLEHLTRLERLGREGYPASPGPPSTTITRLGGEPAVGASVLGRVSAIRRHGRVCFLDLVDEGRRVQLLASADRLGEQEIRELARLVDVGDLLLVTGSSCTSRRGEPSFAVDSWTVLAKSLHPVPFRGLRDPQARLRQRATDLLVHPQAMTVLRHRSAVLASVRTTLVDNGFLEVETPVLHTVHGGASARPFRTYINAYGMDLSLRIAPELYLKRLLVAGAGPVFEISRNFRNEGADATHNPEFTSLEAYQPMGDYTTMRHLTEHLVRAAATAVHGHACVPLPTGPDGAVELTDISGRWPVVPVLDAVSDAVGQPVSIEDDMDDLMALAASHGVAVPPGAGPGTVIEELYGELVEPRTIFPTFYVDFPVETSPLTRGHRARPGLAERWDLVVAGMELGTAYTELTDPLEQRRRLTEQSLKAAAGDPEAMEVDEDFLRDLETGMPPSGGLGIGLDRLVMLITGTTIRSVLSFPFVKPLRGSTTGG